MGGTAASKIPYHRRKPVGRRARDGHQPPTFDQALADRLYTASPLVSDDIRRTFADTYATLVMQIGDLKMRAIEGIITVDEARTIPSLVNHARKVAADLRLLKATDELGLTIDSAPTTEVDDDDDEAT